MKTSATNRLEQSPTHNLAGHLLVASPDWQHGLYGRTVCLVVHHSSQRAIGVVLNRHLPMPAGELWQKLAGDKPVRSTAAVHFGGPQAGPVVAVHDRRDLAEFTSAEGVYIAAQIHNLQQLVASPTGEAQVKIIVGQADWGSGELDRQFAEGNWLPLPVSSGLVFAEDSEMWPRAMHRVGDLVVATMSGARVNPPDVLTN